jgi:hypothetical protein
MRKQELIIPKDLNALQVFLNVLRAFDEEKEFRLVAEMRSPGYPINAVARGCCDERCQSAI